MWCGLGEKRWICPLSDKGHGGADCWKGLQKEGIKKVQKGKMKKSQKEKEEKEGSRRTQFSYKRSKKEPGGHSGAKDEEGTANKRADPALQGSEEPRKELLFKAAK